MDELKQQINKVLELMGSDEDWYERIQLLRKDIVSDNIGTSNKALNQFLDLFGGMMSLNDYVGNNAEHIRPELQKIPDLLKNILRKNWVKLGKASSPSSEKLSNKAEVSLKLGDVKLILWNGEEVYVNEEESTGTWYIQSMVEKDISGAPVYMLSRTLNGPGSNTKIKARVIC